jgi:hypothetical protein
LGRVQLQGHALPARQTARFARAIASGIDGQRMPCGAGSPIARRVMAGLRHPTQNSPSNLTISEANSPVGGITIGKDAQHRGLTFSTGPWHDAHTGRSAMGWSTPTRLPRSTTNPSTLFACRPALA